MLNDVSLPAIGVVHSDSVPAAGQKVPAADSAQAAPAAPPILNPTLRLDAALGLVVIEFRNQTGAITTSIPSQRQLQAYQRWNTTQVGPAPDGESHDRSEPISAKSSISAVASDLGEHKKADPLG